MMNYRLVIAATVIGLLIGTAIVHLSFAGNAKRAPTAAQLSADYVPPDLGPNGPTSDPLGKVQAPPSKATFNAGKILFGNRCARCHGWNMVNLGSIAFDLRKFPHDDEVRFFHDVRYGKQAMPAWKGILTTEEMKEAWAYVRTGGKM